MRIRQAVLPALVLAATLSPAAPFAAAAAPARQATMIRSVPTVRKLIAFTFDDGPNRRWTPAVLALLEHYDAHATFFVVGQEVLRYPTMIRTLESAKMEVGNHGMHHRLLRSLRTDDIRADVVGGESAIVEAGGQKPYLYRLPAAVSDSAARLELRRLGYTIVSWSVDTRDWHPSVTPARIARTVLSQARPGSIVIMHDGPAYRGRTISALRQILPALRKEGYSIVTVGDLLRQSDYRTLRSIPPEVRSPHAARGPHQPVRKGTSWAWRHLFRRQNPA